MSKIEELEQFYMMVDSARGLVPTLASLRSWAERQARALDTVLKDIATEISHSCNPKSVQDIRDWAPSCPLGHQGEQWILERMFDRLLEQTTIETEGVEMIHVFDKVGVHEAYAAPVNSPDELAKWLIDRYRQKMNGK